MTLRIEYEVNGERVATAAGIADADTRSAMEELRAELAEELADVECPVHHEQPSLVISVTDEEELVVGVESCCEQLEELMEQKFADEA